jgi:hypothetical protein
VALIVNFGTGRLVLLLARRGIGWLSGIFWWPIKDLRHLSLRNAPMPGIQLDTSEATLSQSSVERGAG